MNGDTRLLIATHNAGKLREYTEILADLPVSLTYLRDEGITDSVPEDGDTYLENAQRKALVYAETSGLLTLADDSGLEVDALGGRPGVHTARYAGPQADDEERYQLLLRELEGVEWEKRTARFRCVVCIASPEGQTFAAEGVREGYVAHEPAGTGGFGYDPVFYLPECERTMAQLPLRVKNRISHRARAAHNAKLILKPLL